MQQQPILQIDNICCDFSLCKETEKLFYYKFHVIPWQKLNKITFFIVEDVIPDVIGWIELHYGINYILIKAGDNQIVDLLNSHFGVSEFASNYLYYKNPSFSAKNIKLGSIAYASFAIIVSILTLVEKSAYFAFLRLAQMGYKTKMIDSETLEESPTTIFAWIKQRARWIKGYMQTYVFCLKNITGLRGMLLLNLFVGPTAFIFFTAPFLLLSSKFLNELFLYYFIVAYITNSILLIIAVKQQKMPYYFYIVSIFFPVYRLLHSVAAFLALWEFIIYPQKWNKTSHGLWKKSSQKL